MRIIMFALVLVLAAGLSAQAQQTTIRDASGRTTGTASGPRR
jgi:hypothetical protein